MNRKRILFGIILGIMILLYLFSSWAVLFSGFLPFRPLPPALISIYLRIGYALLWLATGLFIAAVTPRWNILWELLFSVGVMVFHVYSIHLLFAMPLSEIVNGDTYLYKVMSFLAGFFLTLALILEFFFSYTKKFVQRLRDRKKESQ